ncbi:MAG: hypothetical protein JXA14_26625 [Anaerolineae bacterium]|nr:hypothetical protein [Anaerolineae bacterium]
MENTAMLLVIAGGIGAAVLGMLVLRLGKRLAVGLLVLGVLVVIGALAFALIGQSAANYQTARAATEAAHAAEIASAGQAATSAANSIITALVLLIVVLVLGLGGTFIGWRWWQNRQKREKWAETVRQAQLYAIMNGQQAPHRPASLQLPTYYQQPPAGGPVIVMAPGPQPPAPAYPPYHGGISLEDLARVMQATQSHDPFDDLLPPDDAGGWEVVG